MKICNEWKEANKLLPFERKCLNHQNSSKFPTEILTLLNKFSQKYFSNPMPEMRSICVWLNFHYINATLTLLIKFHLEKIIYPHLSQSIFFLSTMVTWPKISHYVTPPGSKGYYWTKFQFHAIQVSRKFVNDGNPPKNRLENIDSMNQELRIGRKITTKTAKKRKWIKWRKLENIFPKGQTLYFRGVFRTQLNTYDG